MALFLGLTPGPYSCALILGLDTFNESLHLGGQKNRLRNTIFKCCLSMKCDLARPWVRGALKKNLIQEFAENGEKEG